VVTTAEAARRGDVIFVALPDTKQAAAYKKDVAPNLSAGKTLLFSHGFSIHFKTVVPPKNVDVILVAPKGPGHIVRRQYLEGKGVPCSSRFIKIRVDRRGKWRWRGRRASAAPGRA